MYQPSPAAAPPDEPLNGAMFVEPDPAAPVDQGTSSPPPPAVADRVPANGYEGVDELLLHDGEVWYGCSHPSCDGLRFRTVDLAQQHRRDDHPSAAQAGAARRLPDRVADILAPQILAGDFGGPGDQMPGAKKLASQYGTSHATVNGAYLILRDRGLLEGRGRTGTFIAAAVQIQTPASPPASSPEPPVDMTPVPVVPADVPAAPEPLPDPEPEPEEPVPAPDPAPAVDARAALLQAAAAVQAALRALDDDDRARVVELEGQVRDAEGRADTLRTQLEDALDRAAAWEARINEMTAAARAFLGG